MFHLPIENTEKIERIAERQSRGYDYHILTFLPKSDGDDDNAIPSLTPCSRQSANFQTTEKCYEYTVITDPLHKQVFAYLPPRQTISHKQFIDDYVEGDEVETTEAIEGTMITLFWNDHIQEWDICTRNGVGGNYSFVRPVKSQFSEYPVVLPVTYREMVLDVFRHKMSRNPTDELELHAVPFFQELSKHCFYTCILQHWKNHIVYEPLPENTAFLKLVAIYSVEPGCVVKESDCPDIWRAGNSVFDPLWSYTCLIPNKQILESIVLKESEEDKSQSIARWELHNVKTQYYPPAWILNNRRTGQTTEIQNPHYQRAKALRSMQPNMRYQWLELYKTGRVEMYLHTFSMYADTFEYFHREFDAFVENVFVTYLLYYITKRRELYPKKYFIHAAALHHNVYVPSKLEGAKREITREIVKDYLTAIPTGKLYYYITQE